MGNEEKSFAFLPVDTDWHTHPFQGERNYDGMRRYAESALAKGLKRVIFTEHAPVDPRFGFSNRHHLNEREFETYLECAERCRAEFAGRLEIGIGVEADYHPRNLEYVAKLRENYPFDHVGGSLHLHAGFWADDVAGLSGDARMVYALERTLELVESGLFSGLNHLDFFRWRQPEYVPVRCEERYRAIFAAMVRCDVALELNTSGIHKDFASFLPCREVWDWSLEYPLRRTFGSDAHRPELIADELDAAQTWFPASS